MARKHLIRSGGLTLATLALALLSGCGTWDGNFSIIGYTTQPMYDMSIHTVRVPIFRNLTYVRGLEFEITKAVIREIQAKTPFRVVQEADCADTELLGTVVTINKGIINVNQLGETRVAETTLGVELVWRDLRAGHSGAVLSLPVPGKPGDPPPPPPLPGVPTPPVLVAAIADDIPEIGESTQTAQKRLADKLAVQIVSMMEKPW